MTFNKLYASFQKQKRKQIQDESDEFNKNNNFFLVMKFKIDSKLTEKERDEALEDFILNEEKFILTGINGFDQVDGFQPSGTKHLKLANKVAEAKFAIVRQDQQNGMLLLSSEIYQSLLADNTLNNHLVFGFKNHPTGDSSAFICSTKTYYINNEGFHTSLNISASNYALYSRIRGALALIVGFLNIFLAAPIPLLFGLTALSAPLGLIQIFGQGSQFAASVGFLLGLASIALGIGTLATVGFTVAGIPAGILNITYGLELLNNARLHWQSRNDKLGLMKLRQKISTGGFFDPNNPNRSMPTEVNNNASNRNTRLKLQLPPAPSRSVNRERFDEAPLLPTFS